MSKFETQIIVTMNIHMPTDPIVTHVMEHVFVWANQMGLKGHTCVDFKMEDPYAELHESFDPLNREKTLILCRVKQKEEDDKVPKKDI